MMGSFGLLALALTVAPVQDVTSFEMFQLFNSCEPMYLLLTVPDDNDEDMKNVGLTKDRVQFAVESRLRGARLLRSGTVSAPLLQVRVGVTRTMYDVNMGYYKRLWDPLTDRYGLAETWTAGSVGTHGSKADDIVSKLSELLDKFLTNYLRVNEAACTESPQPPTQ